MYPERIYLLERKTVNLSDSAKKQSNQGLEDSKLPEPEIELTGFNQPSIFGQILNSGLNALATWSGKKKNSSQSIPPIQTEAAKPKVGAYQPTWNKDNLEPHIEHTNFTSAISDYKKQQENPVIRRGAPPPLVIRRQKSAMPFIYKFAVFAVSITLILGSLMYFDKKYNIRQTIQELKDPAKAKLKAKRKPIIDE